MLIASLRTHTRRYVAAVLAVLTGVAFVVVTDALASATRSGLVAGIELPYEGADAVVSDLSGEEAASLLTRARAGGDRAAVLGWTILPVAEGSRLLGGQVDVGAVADDDSLRWQEVVTGRLPTGRGQAVADANAAKSHEVAVGDRLRVGSGPLATEVTVVGLVDSPSASVRASLYLTWADLEPWARSLNVDSVAYAGTPDPSGLGDATVQPVGDFVDERSTELNSGVDVLAYLLLIFAAIALFVSVLVIANTFTILFAQRSRDFALLRCVGATRRQVVGSVRVEALLLGVTASLAGIAAGATIGHGLVALARSLEPNAALGEVSLSWRWLVGAFVVGVAVTLVASWLPTRRVVALSPLAALRPEQAVDARSAAGRVRLAAGGGLVLAGAGLLSLAVTGSSAGAMVAGGATSFTGVLLLAPVLVPALIRLAGRPVGRTLGAAGRLATGNAVRNPRRTAATTASLLIGVTLTTAVLTGLATSRSAVDEEMAAQHPLDLTLTATAEALPAGLVGQVMGTDGVATALAVDGTTARVSRGVGELTVLAPPAGVERVAHADLLSPGPDEILLPDDVAPEQARVAVSVGDRTRTLRVIAGEGWGGSAVVAASTLEALTDSAATRAIWVRAADKADAEDLAGDLTALAAPLDAEVGNGLASRAYMDLQLDILTAAVVALLGIAVLIALIGIGNTLGLSVLERGRENALLRALGLTRVQLRRMLAAEAVLLSVVATVLGTAIGVVFAWVAVEALVSSAVDEAPFVLPWGQLALVVLVAGAAGLLACVLPARRAARVAPAAGLGMD
ncbi:ABC transporter permease [Nocardioides sp. cx-173]|uniref:ABC transporter permease n=1 Tax=Nocardioides sp. cx-173 TaxID=2898796 RepID=UPI001E2DCB31|nr:FtsX family ABC transporter permease [Nocardioides sp. cx-173]MCD4523427.1 ABC transporter permease [Nocardioides sp. cx-173]UGB42234.1 ABC transporter permease [Nocardioides sp. cx-173]